VEDTDKKAHCIAGIIPELKHSHISAYSDGIMLPLLNKLALCYLIENIVLHIVV